jgi:hypothetical protein
MLADLVMSVPELLVTVVTEFEAESFLHLGQALDRAAFHGDHRRCCCGGIRGRQGELRLRHRKEGAHRSTGRLVQRRSAGDRAVVRQLQFVSQTHGGAKE